MSNGNRDTQKLLQFQPEQYLTILSGVCAANWLALIMLAMIFIVTGSLPRDNPAISTLFVVVALEYTSANLILTLALKYRAWLQKTPRQALNRLRQLTTLVFAWDGVHVLGVFDLFGGLQGALAGLLPVLALISFIILPRTVAAWACGAWLCSVLLLLGLQALDIIVPLSGFLDQTHAMALQSKPVFGLVLAGISFASLFFSYRLVHGLNFQGQGENGLYDLRFNCFSLHCWHKRVQDELVRSHAQNSITSIVVLGLKSHDAGPANQSFDALTLQLQQLASAALINTRQDLDSIAYIGCARFALLLPTATQEKCTDVVARIQSHCPDAELELSTSIAPQKPSDALIAGVLSELKIPALASA